MSMSQGSAQKARYAAVKRLVEGHKTEFGDLLKVERVKLGLPETVEATTAQLRVAVEAYEKLLREHGIEVPPIDG